MPGTLRQPGALPILVAGLDSRSLLLEAPVLLREPPAARGERPRRASCSTVWPARARRLVVLGPASPT